MKKTLLIASLLSIVLIGCKDSKEEAVESSEVTEMSRENDAHEVIALNNDIWVEEMQFNEGGKWKANLETTRGVNNMMEIVEGSKPGTVDDYHGMATKLNDEKNIVVKECTMEGASHDNLHTFLHPLIEKIDALGKVQKTEEGAKLQHSIHENLKWYFNYFE